jgi:predicted MFS family arabinose efflux permease
MAAAPSGRIAERLGPRLAVVIGLACAGISLVGIAGLVKSWVPLLVFLAIGGVGLTIAQLGANVLVVRKVPSAKLGRAFGLAQSAFPIAALLAGLSIPVLGVHLGWRAVFIVAAFLIPLAIAALPRQIPLTTSVGGSSGVGSRGALRALSLAMTMLSAGGTACAAFIVASSVDAGMSAAEAGVVLALGSGACVLVRILVGRIADLRPRGSLWLVGLLTFVGAIGYLGLAQASEPAAIGVFATLAFAGGWTDALGKFANVPRRPRRG